MDRCVGSAARASAGALQEITDIYPRTNGLPMTVRVSPRGRARQDVRVEVCRVDDNRMFPEDTAVVSVRPRPKLFAGELAGDWLRSVQSWIVNNQPALVGSWDRAIDGLELAQRLRRV